MRQIMTEVPEIPPSAPLPFGGYKCEFVDSLSKSLTCPVCLLVFRDPHLLSCCGANICESCIGEQVNAAGQLCPLCKQSFTSILDKKEQKKVLNMKVRCSKKKNGCEWVGELRRLEEHVKEDCEWALVQCRYQCGGRIPRHQLAVHEVDECLHRPVDIKLESFVRKMEECHKREMAAVRKQMEQQKKEYEAKMEQLQQLMKGKLH